MAITTNILAIFGALVLLSVASFATRLWIALGSYDGGDE